MNPGDVKLPIPDFLKLFTNNNVPVPKAMVIASKMSVVTRVPNPSAFCPDRYFGISYKEYNTPSKLELLSEVKLKAAGIEDKDDRGLIMQALRKFGYAYKGEALKKVKDSPALIPVSSESSVSASGSTAPVRDHNW